VRSLPATRRAPIQRLREIIQRELPGYREGIEYGMPFYRLGPTEGFAFASRSSGVSVYVGGRVLSTFRTELAKEDLGKGCIRYRHPERIDWELLTRIVRSMAR
jgi:uncharacterized protein YdhG (YjbR/CyaY superfamily)